MSEQGGDESLARPEQTTDTPTSASDAAAARMRSRNIRTTVDALVLQGGAIVGALGLSADNKIAAAVGLTAATVAGGRFVKDLVSTARNNRKDTAIIAEADPKFVELRDKAIINDAELRLARERLKEEDK